YAEVTPVTDAGEYRVGDCSDADLNRSAVLDETSDVSRNRLFDRSDDLPANLHGRPRGADDVVDTRGVDATFALGRGTFGVHLGDDDRRRCHRGLLKIVGDRETVLAVLVRLAQLYEDDVGANDPLGEVTR